MTDHLPLRILAVSCPHHKDSKSYGDGELKSMSSVSLHNTLLAAVAKTDNPDSYWSQSNLVAGDDTSSRMNRRNRVMLLPTMEHMVLFEEKLCQDKPNLLLLGAMTLSYPGAIAFAKRAREILGDKVVIVLGGRHANESIYTINGDVSDVF